MAGSAERGAAVSRALSEFERKVMAYARQNKRLPLGNKRVAWAAAARRLQKRGLLAQFGNGSGWLVTQAGEKALSEVYP